MAKWQRDPDQIKRDRLLIAEWTAQQYKSDEISVMLKKVSGYELKPRTIRADQKAIRTAWQKATIDKYQALVNQELVRLDVLEREAWSAWRHSFDGTNETVVREEIARGIKESIENGEDPTLFIAKVKTTLTPNTPAVQFLNAINEIQKERRKLLGLYAPAQVGLNVNKRSEILIKAYRTVSPDDWDSQESHVAAAAVGAINEELALEAEFLDASNSQ